MLKYIGLTALVTAVTVVTLGCARGPVSPTETPTYAVKPASVPAGVVSKSRFFGATSASTAPVGRCGWPARSMR